jgi:hypothetical protein
MLIFLKPGRMLGAVVREMCMGGRQMLGRPILAYDIVPQLTRAFLHRATRRVAILGATPNTVSAAFRWTPGSIVDKRASILGELWAQLRCYKN